MLLIVLLLGSLGAARARAPPLVDPPGFRLVFEDDFDGATLDTTKWTALDRYVQWRAPFAVESTLRARVRRGEQACELDVSATAGVVQRRLAARVRGDRVRPGSKQHARALGLQHKAREA